MLWLALGGRVRGPAAKGSFWDFAQSNEAEPSSR